MKLPLKFALPLAALGAVAALAAGCGGSSSDASSTPSTAPATTAPATTAPATTAAASAAIAVSASPTALAFDQKELTATAGDVTFDFANPATFPHNLSIKTADGTEVGATDTVTGKDAPPLKLTLKAGTYTFYCSVPGHESAGMTGTLTVT